MESLTRGRRADMKNGRGMREPPGGDEEIVVRHDVAEVMRDLYRLKAEKSLSFGERRMLETARTLIVKEIAVTRSKSEDKIQAEIEEIFETN